jgi:hypothetical protein
MHDDKRLSWGSVTATTALAAWRTLFGRKHEIPSAMHQGVIKCFRVSQPVQSYTPTRPDYKAQNRLPLPKALPLPGCDASVKF